MFNNGFFAFHPLEELLETRRRPRDDWMKDEFDLLARRPTQLGGRWMEEIMEPWSSGAFLGEPQHLSTHHSRCCPHNCLLDRPRAAHKPAAVPRDSLQHFLIVPSLLKQSSRSDQQGASTSKQSKHEASSKESDASRSKEPSSVGTTDSNKGQGNEPWEFSVDMGGCDEVRAMTEGGMLMLEGRGSSDSSRQMVRYITSLPRHVSHDSLTASLNDGRLTVSQKAGAGQLEGQARTLPVDVQQKAPEPSQLQQKEAETADK